MLTTRLSRAALTALLALPVLALVGCSAAPAADASEPVSATASNAADPNAPAAEPQAEADTAVWPDDRCQDDQLSAELVERPALSTAGLQGLAFVFTNVSEEPCAYFGSPGALLLDADGATLLSAGDKLGPAGSPGSGPSVPGGSVAPGEAIQIEGQLSDGGAPDCATATASTIHLVLTSEGPGIDVPADLQVCTDPSSELNIGSYFPVE